MPHLALEEGAKVRTFVPPPRNFDPLKASPAELLKHGFPARPDNPAQLERYKRVFGQMKDRFQYIVPEFVVNTHRRRPSLHKRRAPSAHKNVPLVGTGNETSPIWSGGIVFPPAGQSFRWIVGEWTIPNVSCPDNGITYYCNNWIGIDGGPTVASLDICQAGINLDVTRNGKNTTINCAAWCEWFPGPEMGIPKFPVSVGDTVAITLCTSGAGATEATIFFANITQGFGTSFILEAGTFSDGSQIALVGDCAEWIVERPSLTGGDTPIALLADYGQVFFSGCQAVSYTPDGSSSTVVDGGTQSSMDMLPDGAPDPAGLLSHGILIADEVVQCMYLAPGNGTLGTV
jgi:hypothetical protein